MSARLIQHFTDQANGLLEPRQFYVIPKHIPERNVLEAVPIQMVTPAAVVTEMAKEDVGKKKSIGRRSSKRGRCIF